jgi:hypothetical protein
MTLLSSSFSRRSILIHLLALVPALLFSQITIRERVELKPQTQSKVAGAAQVTSTSLRFVFRSEYAVFLRMYINGLDAYGTGEAELTVPDAPYGTYSFNLQLRVAELWDPFTGSAVTFDIYIGDSLARHDEGRITGGLYTIFGIWHPPNFVYVPPVRIKIELASSTLAPLGDNDNKLNPNYRKEGPDKRRYIIDWSKVGSTGVTVRVNELNGNPVSNYPITMTAFGVDLSGGHDHISNRPSGLFVTTEHDTVDRLWGETNEEGKITCTYLSSGIGGRDSIAAWGYDYDKDTASAIVFLKVKDLEELEPGDHYVLTGAFGDAGVSSRHRTNHYGTSNLLKNLKALSDSVFADSGYALKINDMSLIFGGPFDIANNWDTPHRTHREGVSADIDELYSNGVAIDQEYFERMVTSRPFSGTFLDEKTHFHVTFH